MQGNDGIPKKFNFNSLHVFLTYSQCPLSKEELFEKLSSRFSISSYTIAEESHKQGDPHKLGSHLHALVTFTNKVHSTDPRVFDVAGYHPNIQKASSKADRSRINQYVKKDGRFITNVEELLGKRAQLFTSLLEEGLTPRFVRSNPEIMQLNFQNLRNWLQFVQPAQAPLRDMPKLRHYWISGQANTGKSTYLKAFRQLFHYPAEVPMNDDFAHVDERTDLLWIDEYRGQLKVQTLNRLCDGHARLNTKGGATLIGYPQVVVISNFTMRECYPGVSDQIYDTLCARFICYVAPKYPPFPSCEL